MAMNTVAPPATPLPLVSRQDSTLSLDRTTEQEAIIVDEGFCQIEDPSFGDAASRLACLELEEFEPSSGPGSSKSLGGRTSQRSISSSKSLKASSSKSLQSGQQATSALSKSSSSKSLGTRTSSERHPAPLQASVEALASLRSGDSLPPGSPFGCEEFQSASFPALDTDEAHARLNNMDINSSLLAGLQSLSPDELAVYMQLTEQLVSEGVSQPPASPKTGDAFDKTASQESSVEEAKQDPRLEEAVQKLKTLLPKSAIQQLQSYASYGLLDVVRCQPVTPPPTPTAKEEN